MEKVQREWKRERESGRNRERVEEIERESGRNTE